MWNNGLQDWKPGSEGWCTAHENVDGTTILENILPVS